jgi:hypothetical protein
MPGGVAGERPTRSPPMPIAIAVRHEGRDRSGSPLGAGRLRKTSCFPMQKRYLTTSIGPHPSAEARALP